MKTSARSSSRSSSETFYDDHDASHPVRWSPASDEPVRYLSLEDAVRRIARSQDEPDAEAITHDLMMGVRLQTMFATYEYIDPEPRR